MPPRALKSKIEGGSELLILGQRGRERELEIGRKVRNLKKVRELEREFRNKVEVISLAGKLARENERVRSDLYS